MARLGSTVVRSDGRRIMYETSSGRIVGVHHGAADPGHAWRSIFDPGTNVEILRTSLPERTDGTAAFSDNDGSSASPPQPDEPTALPARRDTSWCWHDPTLPWRQSAHGTGSVQCVHLYQARLKASETLTLTRARGTADGTSSADVTIYFPKPGVVVRTGLA